MLVFTLIEYDPFDRRIAPIAVLTNDTTYALRLMMRDADVYVRCRDHVTHKGLKLDRLHIEARPYRDGLTEKEFREKYRRLLAVWID